jgi:DNA repair protein RadA/Sms
MAKSKKQFCCSECGAIAYQWAGQCADCGAWNTLIETVAAREDHPARAGVARSGNYAGETGHAGIQTLACVEAEPEIRTGSGLSELDRVLGGGIVSGSVVLIGGDPGIGKSTLLLQSIVHLSHGESVLYVTGEESLRQVKLRAHRLGLEGDKVGVLTETCLEQIHHALRQSRPKVVVIDSIQTVYSELLQSAPGSVSQVREVTAQLVRFAKQSGIAIFLVGHVTKEGAIAGPRVLEHMVDTVLYFESDSGSRFRLIRAVKNRFGAANELGVFAMTEQGLKEVGNPSAIFLSNHQSVSSGTIVMATREGSRPMLVEVQALVDESHLGNPRRVAVGLEQNRLAMLLAVLHRHGGYSLYNQDVFINVVGGVRVTETGSDLPALLAVLSSFRDRPVSRDVISFGEVGLSGEIRPVQGGEDRIKEAAKHGFKLAIVPRQNAPAQRKRISGIEVMAVDRLSQAVEYLS